MRENSGSSQLIGIVLIFALLGIYFFYLSPRSSRPPSTTNEGVSESAPGLPTAPRISPTKEQKNIAHQDSLLEEKVIHIETEDLRLGFSSRGAVLINAELKHYKTYKDTPLRLISPQTTQWQQALLYEGKWTTLSNLAFQCQTPSKTQLNSNDSLQLIFSAPWRTQDTLQVIYTIAGKGYVVKTKIKDQGKSTHLRIQWQQAITLSEKNAEDFKLKTVVNYASHEEGFDSFTHNGTEFKTETIPHSMQWISFKQPFFLASLFLAGPNQTQLALRTTPFTNGVSNLNHSVKEARLHANIAHHLKEPLSFNYAYYLGPNDRDALMPMGQHFERNVSLGWGILRWVNKGLTLPFFNLLERFFSNYGLIIIFLSIAIRIVLSPLTYRSYVSMAKMKLLKPEIETVKKEHPNDQKKQQQAVMKVYQSVGINPLSGCIPMLLQMPILLAMFYFFPNAIAFRGESFLWVQDLSTYDSILDLPFDIPFYGDHISLFTLLMTLSTLLYTYLNTSVESAPPQMKVIQYLMPVLFLFFLNSYSASLTFYYFVSNMVSIGQQSLIKRFVNEGKLRAKLEKNRAKNKTGKKSRFQNRLDAAMKERQSNHKR